MNLEIPLALSVKRTESESYPVGPGREVCRAEANLELAKDPGDGLLLFSGVAWQICAKFPWPSHEKTRLSPLAVRHCTFRLYTIVNVL